MYANVRETIWSVRMSSQRLLKAQTNLAHCLRFCLASHLGLTLRSQQKIIAMGNQTH
jgi:hypothetical protein